MHGMVNVNGVSVPNHVYLGEVLDNLGATGSLVVDKETSVEIKYGPGSGN